MVEAKLADEINRLRKSLKGITVAPQLVFLTSVPDPAKLLPIVNPATMPAGGNRGQWLRQHYRGNRPFGGLWTSSHTPGDHHLSDWSRRIACERPLRGTPLTPYVLHPQPSINILEISSAVEAIDFTEQFRIGVVPVSQATIEDDSSTLVAEITDWKRALNIYDGIHLTRAASDAIGRAKIITGMDTAFAAWGCESTLWGRWAFEMPGRV